MHIKKLIASLLLIAVILISFSSSAFAVKPSGNHPEKMLEEEIKQEREQRNSADKIIFEGKYAEIDYFWAKENKDLAKIIENKIKGKGGKVIKRNLREHNLNEWNEVSVEITQQPFLTQDIYSGIEVIGGKKIKVIIEIHRVKRENKDAARVGEIIALGESVIITNNPASDRNDKKKALEIAIDNLWVWE